MRHKVTLTEEHEPGRAPDTPHSGRAANESSVDPDLTSADHVLNLSREGNEYLVGCSFTHVLGSLSTAAPETASEREVLELCLQQVLDPRRVALQWRVEGVWEERYHHHHHHHHPPPPLQ